MGMASEDSEGGGIVGDFGVGTIVWVRRRNGSWWPGRVLGADELAESQLMSPRSGTPVKLLGREDASVDWYNLEKSKRVKPFRCGDFDACIEKAEASYNTPIKKREKYARREEAILHALELERHQVERKESTAISFHADNSTLNICERGSNCNTSEVYDQSKPANKKSQTSSGKISSLLDEYYLDHPLPVHKNRKVKPSICEDDNHEISHLRVEDAGPEVFKSKGKLFHSISGEDIADENQPYLLSQSGCDSVLITKAESGRNFSVLKRKSLQTRTSNGTSAKRRDRRRPLVKVLQNSKRFPISDSLKFHRDRASNMMPEEEDFMGITHEAHEVTNTISSPDADDPFDCSRYSWKHPPCDAGNVFHVQQSGCMSSESTPSGWTEENEFDSSATDSELEIVEEKLRSGVVRTFKLTAESPIESGISQWHLKGKRNHRTIMKKLHESADLKNLGAQLTETSPGIFDPTTLSVALQRQLSSEKEVDYDTEDDELFTRLENRGGHVLSHQSDFIDSDDDPQLASQSGWEPARPSIKMWRAYWVEPEDNFDQFLSSPIIRRIVPMLVDVDLKVQARYQGEHVPLISVTSKLNGKAIIGHPVRIQVLEDGSTDLLLPLNVPEIGDMSPLQTRMIAKRTSMPQAPRLSPGHPPNSSYIESLTPRVKKKSIYHSHRSASGRFQRKPLKTACLSSSQKTKALSSIALEKKFDTESLLSGGLIKPGGSLPVVACIPTKVVFSRILESLGRPSSAVVHRALARIPAEKWTS